MGNNALKTYLFTQVALIAFAANSVICRLALGSFSIDAASFTIVRLSSGLIVLAIILGLRQRQSILYKSATGNWGAAFWLFLYAITFSYAYLSLDTGTGALLLFASVQVTIIIASLFEGVRLKYSEWIGLMLAFSGFVYLVSPGVSAPTVNGFLLMTIAGISWGFYTLKGAGSTNPLADTAFNFLRTLPFLAVVALITFQSFEYSINGLFYAALSGGIASGIGYAIWYAALPGLPPAQAAGVQLLVPVIATIGGIIFSNEMISQRLVIASFMVLGGIAIVVFWKKLAFPFKFLT